jgi:type III secretory pathway component EscV
MVDERVVKEIIELNKHLISIKSIEEISAKLKNIIIEYKDSISGLDSSMYCFVDDLTEGNKKLDNLTIQINELVDKRNDVKHFSKLEDVLKQINIMIGEQNETIQQIYFSFSNSKNEEFKSVQEIKSIIDDIEGKFFPLIDEIKCSVLKLSNFLKYSILDELSNLRQDISGLNEEKDKLLEEIKSIRNLLNNDYLIEIRSTNKSFIDTWVQMQAENNEMRKNIVAIIEQNAALIDFTKTLKDKNEMYKEFIDEMFDAWGRENIRWFAKRVK